MFENITLRLGIIILLVITAVILICSTAIHAVYWAALQPYNVLWPLWSDVLSPVNLATGQAAPLVNALTRNTILPVQPCIAWDPLQPGGSGLPWALYNTPPPFGPGLLFYDVFYGLNSWPPSYMLDPATGAPAPIALPAGWSVLLPTALKGIQYFIPLANAYYNYQYGVPIASLLTAADIWGLTPLALLPPSVI